eukprot:336055_1
MSLFLCLLVVNCLLCMGGLPPSPPSFSWNTIPLFAHTCNVSGAISNDMIELMSSLPIVTIEKYQDNNSTNPYTYNVNDCEIGINCEEDKIISVLKQLRNYNNSVRTVFYLNTFMNFPQYNLSKIFFAENKSLLLHDINNNLVWMGNCGPGHNVTIFDFSNELAIQYWLNTIKYVLNSSFVDGIFGDRANTKLGIGENNNLQCYNFSENKTNLWNIGHNKLIQQTYNLIMSTNKKRGIFIADITDENEANGKLFQEFNVNTIHRLQANNGIRISEAHGANCNVYTKIYNQSLASYLIGAYEYCYYACTKGWINITQWENSFEFYEDYKKDLGEPISNATYNNVSQIYHREFKKGVNVWIDIEGQHPCIKWNDGSITGLQTDCQRYTYDPSQKHHFT